MQHLHGDDPVVFVAGPALGHVGRLAVIARQLKARTNRPIVFVTPGHARYAGPVLNEEFRLVRIPIPDELQRRPAEAFANGLEAVLAELNPRALVCDLCPLRWLSAVRFPDCPRVLVSNFFLTGLLPLETVQSKWLHDEAEYFGALRERRGLPPLRSLRDLYSADKLLLADPAPLLEHLGPLPSGHVVIGHCSYQTDGVLPEALEQLSDLLLLSMGSTGKRTTGSAVVQRIADWSHSSNVVYVGSQSDKIRTAGLAQQCYDWLPLGPLLDRSRVTLTHGGTGSTYLALSRGVALVVNPTHRNQQILGELIEAAGLGFCISDPGDLKKFDTVNFTDVVDKTLRFAHQVTKHNGADTGAREIEEFI